MATSGMTAYEKETKAFLDRISSKFQWMNLDGELVMDIGCGNGENSTKFTLKRYPRVERLFAIDKAYKVIALAKIRNQSDKIEYHVADIEKRSTLESWKGRISKIISIHSLNFVEDERTAFQNVFDLLVPGGQAAFRFTLRSTFYATFAEVVERPAWKPFLKGIPVIPEANKRNLEASHYIDIFNDIGFIIHECREMHGSHSNKTAEQWKRTITAYPFINAIPEEAMDSFKEDLFSTFIKHNSKTPSGHFLMEYTTLEALLRRPLTDAF